MTGPVFARVPALQPWSGEGVPVAPVVISWKELQEASAAPAPSDVQRLAGSKVVSGEIASSKIFFTMGNVLFCDCQEIHPMQVKNDGLDEVCRQMLERIFELYDFENDGSVSLREFVTMKLNQKSAHVELKEEEARLLREEMIRLYREQLDEGLQPVRCKTFVECMWRNVKLLEPTDRNAQFLILEGLLIEAQMAREMVEGSRQRTLPTLLTQIPRAAEGAQFSPKGKVVGPPLTALV
ncbi:unnamed protein product [Durusdinium trenchii]|uniref:EF-hand domain-containing protein n=1 Tax=Durusdinium trenchii TaxID=1381693 RepID=A0ABP0JCK4_9DINO